MKKKLIEGLLKSQDMIPVYIREEMEEETYRSRSVFIHTLHSESMAYDRLKDLLPGYRFSIRKGTYCTKTAKMEGFWVLAMERNISMDTYVMSKQIFIDLIKKSRKESSAYSLADMIALSCKDLDVRGVQHRGFFAAVTSLDDYYRANMELLDYSTAMEFFRPEWPIYTKTTDACPTQYFHGAKVTNSMICNASLIEGTVENSIIGRNVHIGKNAVVRNSIVLAYNNIADGVHIENAVIDKWADIRNVKRVVSDSVTPAYVKRNDIL